MNVPIGCGVCTVIRSRDFTSWIPEEMSKQQRENIIAINTDELQSPTVSESCLGSSFLNLRSVSQTNGGMRSDLELLGTIAISPREKLRRNLTESNPRRTGEML